MNITLSIDERDDLERSIEEFTQLSGKGDSRGWRFNRDDVHEREEFGFAASFVFCGLKW